MKFLLIVVLTVVGSFSIIAGCTVPERDDRICLNWKSRVVIREKCIPMYGNLICADEEKVETWCVLYEEPISKPEEEDER